MVANFSVEIRPGLIVAVVESGEKRNSGLEHVDSVHWGSDAHFFEVFFSDFDHTSGNILEEFKSSGFLAKLGYSSLHSIL